MRRRRPRWPQRLIGAPPNSAHLTACRIGHGRCAAAHAVHPCDSRPQSAIGIRAAAVDIRLGALLWLDALSIEPADRLMTNHALTAGGWPIWRSAWCADTRLPRARRRTESPSWVICTRSDQRLPSVDGGRSSAICFLWFRTGPSARSICSPSAGNPGLTSHIWRRAVAAIMEPSGLSARAGADQLGHRQAGTTLNRYRGTGIRCTGAAQVARVSRFLPASPGSPLIIRPLHWLYDPRQGGQGGSENHR
jgi:hypothetical protein